MLFSITICYNQLCEQFDRDVILSLTSFQYESTIFCAVITIIKVCNYIISNVVRYSYVEHGLIANMERNVTSVIDSLKYMTKQ